MSEQTTGQITSKHSTLEVSSDQVAAYSDVGNWIDLSGSVSAFEPTGGASMTGSTHTYGPHHLPLIGIGKREPVEATVRIIYTEEDAEATDLIDGFAENQTLVWLRHRPKGAVAGAWEFVGRGYFTERPKVAPDATSADILLCEVPWFGRELDLRVSGTT